jgi:tRNA A-37 threonylcarbamoyl transferase component Bud32
MNEGERWRRVRDLFERAFEEKPADLSAWLDRQGVDDWQVREEVASLIQHHNDAGTFLANPAGDRLEQFIADDPPFEPGRVLGHYKILREINSGGQGRVYLANDERLGRKVALKALSRNPTADPSHRERLRREAEAAAKLSHPGICTVHALEEFDGELYIASEFIDGHTLREEIKNHRPTANEVVRLGQELARALGHAHGSGITHRDLKPENVMRANDGRLKVVDFGLAHIETANAVGAFMTRTGTFTGTPAYMAPEQLNGERGDARADVWALGVVLYEYACSIHPFQAATLPALVGRILEGNPDPISRRRSDLPVSVVRVVERCLSKSPGDRYASAVEIVGDLERDAPQTRPMTLWWRTHQFVVLALYFIACGLTWQIKEWQPGVAFALFFAASIVATVAGIFRGHLLFAERINSSRFGTELQRALPVLLVGDVLLGLTLAADGFLLAAVRPVAGVLTIALGVGIALTRVLVEPATTAASFK